MLFLSTPKLRLPLAMLMLAMPLMANAKPEISLIKTTNPIASAQITKPEVPINIYELTSSLKVNGRLLGPQKVIVPGKKTHIGIFRESASRQYQVTYSITPKSDTVEVLASVSTVLFKPSFQLMGGQQASVRQTPDLPEIEFIVSAKKLAVKPSNQPLPVKPKTTP